MLIPIETVYKGYRFRSRLEARWAVFFDTLGLKWEYEPEGFALKHGMNYLPDFWLPEQGYIEIKPSIEAITDYDIARWQTFRIEEPLFVMVGTPGLPKFKPRNSSTTNVIVEDGSYAISFGKRDSTEFFYHSKGDSSFPKDFIDPRPYIWQERKQDKSVLLWPVYAVEMAPNQDDPPEGSIAIFLPGVENSGFFGWINPGMTKMYDSDKLRVAYTAARQARFEHGENGFKKG